MEQLTTYDAVIVGGGPAGATAAEYLASKKHNVLLLNRDGRIKPCGGAIPPRLIRDFDIPDRLLVARARSARIVAPSNKKVDMPIEGGFVGLVDRETFDEFLRDRAQKAGADRRAGKFIRVERDTDGTAIVVYQPADKSESAEPVRVRARTIVGADGARSKVAGQCVKGGDKYYSVFAYHEIIKIPEALPDGYDRDRCDIYYTSKLSPDFYAWIFPHGGTASVGVGSAKKGFGLRSAAHQLRAATGLDSCTTVRTEGAPIPLKPLKKWDNGQDVVLAGDAAGVVAPSSGEGIYYAMIGGQYAAEAVEECLATGNPKALAQARKRFMKSNGMTFWVLGIMQYFWYCSDKRRERFVKMCDDPDVQRLTWQAYMNKELVKADPGAHVRIFFKDLGHLMGVGRT